MVGLAWFIYLMAHQLHMGYLMLKFDSFVNVITIFSMFHCIYKKSTTIYLESFVYMVLYDLIILSNTNNLQLNGFKYSYLTSIILICNNHLFAVSSISSNYK